MGRMLGSRLQRGRITAFGVHDLPKVSIRYRLGTLQAYEIWVHFLHSLCRAWFSSNWVWFCRPLSDWSHCFQYGICATYIIHKATIKRLWTPEANHVHKMQHTVFKFSTKCPNNHYQRSGKNPQLKYLEFRFTFLGSV